MRREMLRDCRASGRNAMKQGQTAARNMCGVGTEYTDTFAAKNTINFFGLVNSLPRKDQTGRRG